MATRVCVLCIVYCALCVMCYVFCVREDERGEVSLMRSEEEDIERLSSAGCAKCTMTIPIVQFQSLYEILVESGEIKTKPKGDK